MTLPYCIDLNRRFSSQAEWNAFAVADLRSQIAYWRGRSERLIADGCPEIATVTARQNIRQLESQVLRYEAERYEVEFLGERWRVVRHQCDGTRYECEIEVPESLEMAVEEWAEVTGQWRLYVQ
jgi:hypothetical protein